VRKTDLNEYGVGLVLYFQFLKYVGIMMLILTLLSVPNMLVFYYSTFDGQFIVDSGGSFLTADQSFYD
jgi:type IV secretory pathway VirB6-like protein